MVERLLRIDAVTENTATQEADPLKLAQRTWQSRCRDSLIGYLNVVDTVRLFS